MKLQLIILAFIVSSLLLISEGAVVWNKLQEDARISAITEPNACSEVGGVIERVCSSGTEMCVVKYSDAGKSCADSSECLGACLSVDVHAQLGDMVKGVCAVSTTPCGLFLPVKNGEVAAKRWVD